jgi:hypothetical protein
MSAAPQPAEKAAIRRVSANAKAIGRHAARATGLGRKRKASLSRERAELAEPAFLQVAVNIAIAKGSRAHAGSGRLLSQANLEKARQ